MSGLVLAFEFTMFLSGLVWVVFGVLNFWIWQKSKANGNLLMLVASALLFFAWFFGGVGVNLGYATFLWLNLIGVILLAAGFFLSVKPMVAAHLAALQAKMKNVTSKGGGTSAPPPAGGTPAS